jgi:hypothetical protein
MKRRTSSRTDPGTYVGFDIRKPVPFKARGMFRARLEGSGLSATFGRSVPGGSSFLPPVDLR